MSQERIYWLAWSKVNGVGPILVDRLYQQFGNLEAAWHADDDKILQIEGVGALSGAKILAARAQIGRAHV